MTSTSGSNVLAALWSKIRAFFFPPQDEIPTEMRRKVLVISFRPEAACQEAVQSGWKHPDELVSQYIEAMRKASKNFLIYEVAKKVEVDYFPTTEDGRCYDNQSWSQARKNDQQAFRNTDGRYVMMDYRRLIQDFKLVEAVREGQIDEVWMFGGPYFGFYESCMVGRAAFDCNGASIQENCRRFVIMGFNYERDVKEMVHDYGHRAERILAKKFGTLQFLTHLYSTQQAPSPRHAFEKFLLNHGTVHRVPGGPEYSQDELAWVSAMEPEWWPPTIDPNRV